MKVEEESRRYSKRRTNTSAFRMREREFLRWNGGVLQEKEAMRSAATAIRVSTSATSVRSTGARNASSDGDRRRLIEENIAADAITQ